MVFEYITFFIFLFFYFYTLIHPWTKGEEETLSFPYYLGLIIFTLIALLFLYGSTRSQMGLIKLNTTALAIIGAVALLPAISGLIYYTR